MGNLADFLMGCERNVKQEGLSQTLGWAFLHWKWYCELRGWTVEYLIDETCRAFEDKHVPGFNLSAEDRMHLRIMRGYAQTVAEKSGKALVDVLTHRAMEDWGATHMEAQHMARWAVADLERPDLSLETVSSEIQETAQHDLPAVKKVKHWDGAHFRGQDRTL